MQLKSFQRRALHNKGKHTAICERSKHIVIAALDVFQRYQLEARDVPDRAFIIGQILIRIELLPQVKLKNLQHGALVDLYKVQSTVESKRVVSVDDGCDDVLAVRGKLNLRN